MRANRITISPRLILLIVPIFIYRFVLVIATLSNKVYGSLFS